MSENLLKTGGRGGVWGGGGQGAAVQGVQVKGGREERESRKESERESEREGAL